MGSSGAGTGLWLLWTALTPSTGHASGWPASLPSHTQSPCTAERGGPQTAAVLKQKAELKCAVAFLFALW